MQFKLLQFYKVLSNFSTSLISAFLALLIYQQTGKIYLSVLVFILMTLSNLIFTLIFKKWLYEKAQICLLIRIVPIILMQVALTLLPKLPILAVVLCGTFTGIRALNESNPQANDPNPQVSLAVKGGTFKVGAKINEAGRIEIYDVSNRLIGTFDENGICIYGKDGSRVVINPEEFTGYDHTGAKVFWMNGDEFHMKKSVIEEEITLCGLARWLGIQTTDNTGIGIVPLT